MKGSLGSRRRSSESGIALPMALIVLGLLTTLTLAFLAITVSEPSIAMNQMMNAQARALADPLPSPVPAPYDGSQYVAMGAGGFIVTVADGAASNDRVVTSIGYVPNNTNPIAIKKIQTVVSKVKSLDPPCAICAGGENPPGTASQIQIGGSASINGSSASGAQYCAGVTPTAAAYASGSIGTNGHPDLTAPPGGVAIAANQPASSFAPFLFTDSDMAILKSLAKANGTYYQGDQHWTSPQPNGVIFVDRPSGNPFTNNSPDCDIIGVDIHGNWRSGWS